MFVEEIALHKGPPIMTAEERSALCPRGILMGVAFFFTNVCIRYKMVSSVKWVNEVSTQLKTLVKPSMLLGGGSFFA